MENNKTKHIFGSTARTLLAVTFLFSGFVKAVDPLGTVYKIEDYLELGFGGVLHWAMPLAGTLAILLITTELLLGVTMLLNVRSRWTSWITLGFYLLMTPVTLYIAIANPVTDCGCFGDALVISNWATFAKNVMLLAFAITFVVCRKAVPQLFVWKAELGIALIGLGLAAGMMGYSYTHLPMLDFRPYKVGADIMELTQGPSPDTTIVTCVYEKGGVQKKFDLNNLPKNGEGWTFIDSKSTPCKIEGEGENQRFVPIDLEPAINDFVLSEYFGEDDNIGFEVTSEILGLDKVTLICMHDLAKANKKQADRAVALYKSLYDKGEACYIITSSNPKKTKAFAKEKQLEYEAFLYLDKKPLETIVRANPGVFVVQNGIIIEKYNLRNK